MAQSILFVMDCDGNQARIVGEDEVIAKIERLLRKAGWQWKEQEGGREEDVDEACLQEGFCGA